MYLAALDQAVARGTGRISASVKYNHRRDHKQPGEHADDTEQIKDKYNDRIMAIMRRIASALKDDGHLIEGPDFWDGDDYRWTLLVHTDGEASEVSQDDIDIAFKICESEEYDGSEGGVNFALDIVEVSGRIIGGLTPFNYSDRCWVDREDAEAVEERFRILEQADEADIPALIGRQAC